MPTVTASTHRRALSKGPIGDAGGGSPCRGHVLPTACRTETALRRAAGMRERNRGLGHPPPDTLPSRRRRPRSACRTRPPDARGSVWSPVSARLVGQQGGPDTFQRSATTQEPVDSPGVAYRGHGPESSGGHTTMSVPVRECSRVRPPVRLCTPPRRRYVGSPPTLSLLDYGRGS